MWDEQYQAFQPERFELTWGRIESLCSSGAEANNGLVAVSGIHLTNGQTVQEAATALEIILTCRTFSPVIFERVNGAWQRAGSKLKHENTEGC